MAGRRNGKVRVFSYQAGQILDTGVYIRAKRHKKKRMIITTCDTDGDMQEEIITFTGGKRTTVARIWEVSTKAQMEKWTAKKVREFKVHKRVRGVSCADTDGDGIEEIYTITNKNVIKYATEGHKISVLFKLERPRSIAIGDIDGDGMKDIVIGRTDGTVELWDVEGQRQGIFRAFGSYTGVRVSTGDIGL